MIIEAQQYVPLWVPPLKKKIFCKDKTIEIFEVKIEDLEYDICVSHSTDMWANLKTGEWGSGLINSRKDERKAERIGNLGEMGFAKVFCLPVDFSYKTGGDSQDFLIRGKYLLNVKTAAYNYEEGLIKCRTDTGIEIPLTHDVYVFAYVGLENRRDRRAFVYLVGYEKLEVVRALPEVPAKKGGHFNKSVGYEKALSISKLYESFQEKNLIRYP